MTCGHFTLLIIIIVKRPYISNLMNLKIFFEELFFLIGTVLYFYLIYKEEEEEIDTDVNKVGFMICILFSTIVLSEMI